MTAPTVAVEYLLARAAVRSTGLLHIVSRRDSGALNPVCGANPIRSAEIEERHTLDDVTLLCPACGAHAASLAGSIEEGVAVYLGRGTGAGAGGRLVLLELSTERIDVDADQARRSPGNIDGLLDSVAEHGVRQPLVVRRTADGYELVAGLRRLYAARVAGLATVPAVVRDLTDGEAAVDGLLENLHRADLNPIEQAHAYARAMKVLDCSIAKLAQRLGISRPQVSNTLRLLGLPEDLQDRIADGALTAQQGRELLSIEDPAEQASLAARLLEARTAAPGRRPVDPQLAGVAQLLGGLLEARVQVSANARGTRIVIEVPDEDRGRVLEQLGLQAAAA